MPPKRKNFGGGGGGPGRYQPPLIQKNIEQIARAPSNVHSEKFTAIAGTVVDNNPLVLLGQKDKVRVCKPNGEQYYETQMQGEVTAIAASGNIAAVAVVGITNASIVSVANISLYMIYPDRLEFGVTLSEPLGGRYSHKLTVSCLSMTTVGGHPAIASGSKDGTVKIWGPVGPECKQQIEIDAHARGVLDMKVCEDELYTMGDDVYVSIWNLHPVSLKYSIHPSNLHGCIQHASSGGEQPFCRLAGMEFIPSQKMLLTAATDGSIKAISAEHGPQGAYNPSPPCNEYNLLQCIRLVTLNGKHYLACGYRDSMVVIRQLPDFTEVASYGIDQTKGDKKARAVIDIIEIPTPTTENMLFVIREDFAFFALKCNLPA